MMQPNIETSAPFLYLNQGKKSVALDISHPEAGHIVKRLAADSDVVVESFKPGFSVGGGVGLRAPSERSTRR